MNIPEPINDCEQLIDNIIDLSLSSISSIPPNSTLKTEIIETIKKIEIYIQQYVYDILIEFPLLNDLDKYISDEIDILIDRSKYHYSLGELNRTIKDVEFVLLNYSLLFESSASSSTSLIPLFKTVIGRICSILRGKSRPIQYLNHVIEAFHSIPIIQDSLSTIILLGNKTDDLLFSIVMGNTGNNSLDISLDGSSSGGGINNNNNSQDELIDEDEDEDENIDYEDDEKEKELKLQQQQLIIRSYKFNDNSIYKDEYGTGVGNNNNNNNNESTSITTAKDQLLQQQKAFIKPFNIATVNNFQIIETPSLSLIKESKNSIILLDMVKAILNNLDSLVLFNIDFNLDINEQIDYYLNIRPYISRIDQCCLVFTNCQSSISSLEFIEFLKQRLLSSNQMLEIPSIYIYEQHINQIKEHIIRYKNYPISPFKNNGINNLNSSLTMLEIQDQLNRAQQQQQQQSSNSDIDIDILNKINKLDLN